MFLRLLRVLYKKIGYAGIFDIKWRPIGGKVGPFLAQADADADADGYVNVYSLECSLDDPSAREWFLRQINCEKISSSMCLCLEWNPSFTTIMVGLSDGSVAIFLLWSPNLKFYKDGKHMILSYGLLHLTSTNLIWCILALTTTSSVVGIYGIVLPSWHSRIPRSIRWAFVVLQRALVTLTLYLLVVSLEGKRKNSSVATFSFYDRLLRIWMPESDNLA